MAEVACTHLDQISVRPPPRDEIEGCEECLKIGARWMHLRACLSCGMIGCCDSSPNRHASGHAQESGHPLISSVEPGEEWSYCFVDDVAFVVDLGEEPS